MSTKKLFELVEYNNSTELEKLINGKKKINLDVENKVYLIENAIQFRAKECFDLLLKTDIHITHGLEMSIRLLQDPNPTNRYYFDKIIEKLGDISNIYIESYSRYPNMYKILLENIIKFNIKINYPIVILYKKKEDFIILLEKYTSQPDSDLIVLIRDCIKQSNGFINLVYEQLEKTKPEYYSDIKSIQISNSHILQMAIGMGKMDIVQLIMTKPVKWTQIDGIPSLYLTIDKKTDQLFNYFFDMFKGLSPEELEQIENICTFRPVLYEYDLVNLFEPNRLNRYKKIILELPIKFDPDDLVYMLTMIIYCLVVQYKSTDNNVTLEFVEFVLEYIKKNYPNVTYNNISSKLLNDNFVEHHNKTWEKLSNLIGFKCNEDEKKLMIPYMMGGDMVLPEYLIKHFKEISTSYEYGQIVTIHSKDFIFCEIRYTNKFKDLITKITPIFTKYNFKIKELEDFIK